MNSSLYSVRMIDLWIGVGMGVCIGFALTHSQQGLGRLLVMLVLSTFYLPIGTMLSLCCRVVSKHWPPRLGAIVWLITGFIVLVALSIYPPWALGDHPDFPVVKFGWLWNRPDPEIAGEQVNLYSGIWMLLLSAISTLFLVFHHISIWMDTKPTSD